MKKKWVSIVCLALCMGICSMGAFLAVPTKTAKAKESVYLWPDKGLGVNVNAGYSGNPYLGDVAIIVETDDSEVWGPDTPNLVFNPQYNVNKVNANAESLKKVTYTRGSETISAHSYAYVGKGVTYGFASSVNTTLTKTPQSGDVFTVAEDFTFTVNQNKDKTWETRTFRYATALDYVYDGESWKANYTVTFDNEGEITTQKVMQGNAANKPDDPVKNGYTFDGWYNGESKYDFTSPVTENFTLTAKWIENLAVKTMSVSLKGKIEVNLGVELADESKADTAYLSVVIGEEAEQKFYFKDVTKDENGKYYFKVPVAAAQMTENIKVKSVAGESESKLQTFTVRKYADYLLSEAANSSEELKNLVKAMLDYGAYAQQAFNVNTENFANAGIWESVGSPVTTAEVPNKTMEANGTATDLTVGTLDMLLQSDNTLRLYFTTNGEINNYKAVLTYNDGEERTFDLEIAKDGDRYYADVPHVPAPYLGTDYTITFTNMTDNTTCAVTVSAYAYANGLVKLETATAVQKNVAKALYLYGEAAKAYNGYTK